MRLTMILLLMFLLATSAWAGTVKELKNKEWKLQSFGQIGKEAPLIPGTNITIWFDKEQSSWGRLWFNLEGFSGCNWYYGFYEAKEDGTLSVRVDMFTLKPRLDPRVGKQEDQYLRALGFFKPDNVSAFEIKQKRLQTCLRLFYDDKTGVLNFVDIILAVEPKSKLPTTWGRIKSVE